MLTTAQQPINISDPLRTDILYDAWIYPDAAEAKATLKNHDNIHAVKVEFLHVEDDGSLTQINHSEESPNGYSEENVALIKQHSREQYITVSGMMDGTQAAMQDPATIDTIVNLANKTGFGIELDWEEFGRWTPEYYQEFTAFLQKLRTKLHANGHKLAIDGPPIPDEASQNWYQWKYEELAPVVDSIVMMVYDNQYDTGTGNSIAPRQWSLACMKWLKEKADDKGVVGVAAYGYKGESDTGGIAVNTSENIKRQLGSTAVRRNSDGELTAINGNNFYAYADEQTMEVRLQQVKQAGFKHLSVWSLGNNPWFRQ